MNEAHVNEWKSEGVNEWANECLEEWALCGEAGGGCGGGYQGGRKGRGRKRLVMWSVLEGLLLKYTPLQTTKYMLCDVTFWVVCWFRTICPKYFGLCQNCHTPICRWYCHFTATATTPQKVKTSIIHLFKLLLYWTTVNYLKYIHINKYSVTCISLQYVW